MVKTGPSILKHKRTHRNRMTVILIIILTMLNFSLFSGVILTPATEPDTVLHAAGSTRSDNSSRSGTVWEQVDELECILDLGKCGDSFIKISTGPDVPRRLEQKAKPDYIKFLSNTALNAINQAPDWLKENLTGKFIELSQLRLDLGDDANAGFGDLDGDGDLDMFCGAREGGLKYYENRGTRFEPILIQDDLDIVTEDLNLNFLDPSCGDLDNDGDLDIVVGNEIGDIIIFYNTGSNDKPIYNNIYRFVEILSGYSSPCVGDIDADDDLDLICGAEDGRIYTIINLGQEFNYTYVMPPIPEIIDVGSRSKPCLADLDGDGDLDLTIGEDQAIINYYENTGSPQNAVWRYDSSVYLGLTLSTQTSPTLADLNGDYRFDLVVGGSPGQLYKFDNIGSGTEPAWEIWSSYKVFPGIEYYDPIQYVTYVDHVTLDKFAELILFAKDNHKDEVAFSIAHTSSQVLLNPSTTPELYKRNAELLYEIDDYLEYADIIDHGAYPDSNYYSTVRYKYKEKNDSLIRTTELPRDIYYWYIVHPKITDEVPAYINPVTGEPTQAPLGRFWREYLFYHNDTEYPEDPPTDPDGNGIPNFQYPKEESPPLLKEKLTGIEYVYDSQPYNAPRGYDPKGYNNTRPWGYKDHAIEAVSNWVEKTLPLNEQESADGERPIQPVRIAHHHNGNCGELQDLTIAAARTALIPAVGILLMAEDHVWNEFYDRGWHQWDNYWSDSGSVVDNFMNYWVGWGQRGGSGLTKWHGDDSTSEVTQFYVPEEDLSTINVTVYDRLGNPVDGARVMLGSHWLTGQATGYQVSFPYPSIWNYTDTNGSCQFRVATQEGMPDGNKNFSFKVISKLGNAERPRTQLEHGQDYEFRFILDGSLPEDGLSYNIPSVQDPPNRFTVMAYWEELAANQNPPNPMVGNSHPQRVTIGREVKFYLLNESNFEYYCKSNYLSDGFVSCVPVENCNSVEEVVYSYQLLDNTNWYFVGYHKNTVETCKQVKLNLLLYEMKDELPFVQINKPKPGSEFQVGEVVEISGIASDDRGIEKLILTINDEKIDILESLQDDTWTYLWDTSRATEGNYSIFVYAEDANGNGLGVYSLVILNPAPPSDITPPVIKIEQPENGSTFLIGTTVEFQGKAKDDSGLELKSLSLTIDSKSINLMEHLNVGLWTYFWDTNGKNEGKYEFRLRGVDHNDNIGYAFGHFELIKEEKDIDPPVISIDSPKLADSYALGSNIIVKGTVTDNVGVAKLEINLDYIGWLDITNNLIGKTFTYTWSTGILGTTIGEHIISVRAGDAAENSDEVTTIIQLVDESAPTVKIQTPLDAETFATGDVMVIRGSYEDNVGIDDLVITIIGEARGDTIEITKGIELTEAGWRYDWLIPNYLDEGSYTITVIAADRFGNTDEESVIVNINAPKKADKEEGLLGLPGFEVVMLILVVFVLVIISKRRK